VGQVTYVREMRNGTMGDLALGGTVILNSITRKYGVRLWTILDWLRIGSNGLFLCTQHNLRVPWKPGLFTDHLSDY
jgi:hypothetical protein